MTQPYEADFTSLETRALMHMAQNIISFERIEVESDDQRPCTIYRSYIDADGHHQIVKLGECFVGDIDFDVKEPEPRPQQNRVWVAIDFPDLRTGQF